MNPWQFNEADRKWFEEKVKGLRGNRNTKLDHLGPQENMSFKNHEAVMIQEAEARFEPSNYSFWGR
jgi:hypothetical protein